jgi:hypothetical protein
MMCNVHFKLVKPFQHGGPQLLKHIACAAISVWQGILRRQGEKELTCHDSNKDVHAQLPSRTIMFH